MIPGRGHDVGRQEDVVKHDPKSEAFWDRKDLRREMLRVFDVCQGCRLCFKFCPSFPSLFNAIDDAHDGETDKLTDAEMREVVDLCFQCKLCFVNCPYTPDQNHPFQVDFPRLMLRDRMVRAREEGVTAQDRFLGNPDLTGAIGSLTTPFSNWAIRSPFARRLMEKTIGVHRDREIPRFHRTTFERWFRKCEKRLARRSKGTGGKVALFYTCSVNYNEPDIGRSAVQVLAHHDVAIVIPEQRCCGMPYLDGGDYAGAMENLRFNVRSMRRFADDGYSIVALQPTCSYVLRKEYPWLEATEGSRAVASATTDICEFLMKLHAEGKLDTAFKSSPGRVLYHFPCHLKAQQIGQKSRELLQLIPGCQVDTIDRCSGMDGTWGMKRQYYEASRKVASPIILRAEESRPDRICSDCALAGLQIRQGSVARAAHPVEILREAYGLGLKV
jgi:glycerol-3-phosphate dehydrogenase subunit C